MAKDKHLILAIQAQHHPYLGQFDEEWIQRPIHMLPILGIGEKPKSCAKSMPLQLPYLGPGCHNDAHI